MIKLISFKNCPFVQRVMGSLIAKNIEFEIEYIELSNKPQWFLDISPNGQVPVLVTEDKTVLFESDAIVEYLDDKYAPIEQVSAEQRALDRAWSYQASKHYMPQCGTMSAKDKNTFEARLEKLKASFTKAEDQLGDGPYFKGKQLSNIDIAWLPILHRAHVVEKHSGFNLIGGFPKVQLWQQALIASGMAEKTVPDDFEEVFSRFYLGDTYLGKLARNEECNTTSSCANKAVSCCG